MAELVLELTQSTAGIVNQPLPADDPRQRQPDIGLARRTLDREPTTPLREGLTRTIGYFRKVIA